jgi:hypothetical protein
MPQTSPDPLPSHVSASFRGPPLNWGTPCFSTESKKARLMNHYACYSTWPGMFKKPTLGQADTVNGEFTARELCLLKYAIGQGSSGAQMGKKSLRRLGPWREGEREQLDRIESNFCWSRARTLLPSGKDRSGRLSLAKIESCYSPKLWPTWEPIT